MVFKVGLRRERKAQKISLLSSISQKTKLSDLTPTCAHEKSSQYMCDLNIT